VDQDTEHVADFKTTMLAKGDDSNYVTQAISRVTNVLKKCAADRIRDISMSAVQRTLGEFRKAGRSLATCNGYLRSIKCFTAWLHRDKRLRDDPLKTIATYNESTDRRHVRREPSEEELQWLIDTTNERTETNHALPGPDRAMLYLLAAGTGLRASELRSLVTESFEFNKDLPVVKVAAAYSKRRRDDAQPLSQNLANILVPWLAHKSPGERVFRTIPRGTARMLRGDLDAAREAWIEAGKTEEERQKRGKLDFLRFKTAAGIFDFHSLRHAYISAIVNSGASVKVAQELARHSSPTLTIGRYSHVRLNDLKGALDAVPTPHSGAATEPRAPVEAQHKAQHALQRTGCPPEQNGAAGCETLAATADESGVDTGRANSQLVTELGDRVRRRAASNA
jgi:integrase